VGTRQPWAFPSFPSLPLLFFFFCSSYPPSHGYNPCTMDPLPKMHPSDFSWLLLLHLVPQSESVVTDGLACKFPPIPHIHVFSADCLLYLLPASCWLLSCPTLQPR
jgi:hypothetical protein